jgi:Mg2+-importing ATPase
VNQSPSQFWSIPADEVMRTLGTSERGLASSEAANRRATHGPNAIRPHRNTGTFTLLIRQFNSPIILILIVAAVLSLFLSDSVDAIIIMAIVFASGLLGFWQEKGATAAVAKLLELVRVTARVLRDGNEMNVPIEDMVPGDIVLFSAGGSVPGDCLLLEAENLSVDEAALTGETYPVAKTPGTLDPSTPLAERTNALFMGTHVVSGTGRGMVVATGAATELGSISAHLEATPPVTEFERGIRRFGSLLLEITLLLVLMIFAVNVYLHRPVIDSFLFSIALAVGLTPQLLPAIISINLSHGARAMAARKVIVKRLSAIENFGSMNILCSDKTGTLTEGEVRLDEALDIDGKPSEKVMLYAFLNARFQNGFRNPIDDAIAAHEGSDIARYSKLDEIPYDFERKRLTVLVGGEKEPVMITKGALKEVLAVCTHAGLPDGSAIPIAEASERIEECFEHQSSQGHRVLGVATRVIAGRDHINNDDEKDLTFIGIITLADPPKEDIAATVDRLKGLGVTLKIITGDNHLVARNVARQIGIEDPDLITGAELNAISDQALPRRIADVEIFAEVEPNQKERIIRGLRNAGNVVGYIGDGINDAPALHAADVGLSVNNAVDVAKEAAAIVLLEHDLNVLADGIHEGRVTFANTLKYVFMATSANFGNMFSMAGASLFLPFLPLLPKQILVTNFLTDLPEMTIAADSVDPSMINQPRRWDIAFIKRFMIVFGVVSSLFDYITFGVLLWLLHASTSEFRTGWLMESVISATTIVLVVRTRQPFYKSRPGKLLMLMTGVVIVATAALPYTPLREPLGLAPLPPLYLAVLGCIVIAYLVVAEIAKRIFYRMWDRRKPRHHAHHGYGAW